MQEVRSSVVRAAITVVHIGKFYKIHLTIVRFSFFPRIVKRSIGGFRIKAKVKIKIKPLICQSKANLKAEFALVKSRMY